MIVYNITVQVAAAIATPWLHWLHETFAPQVVATGCFHTYHVLHLLEIDDADGPTYAIQFQAPDLDTFDRYRMQYGDALQQQAIERWGSDFVWFTTVMEQLS